MAGPLHRHISKSASDLSEHFGGRSGEESQRIGPHATRCGPGDCPQSLPQIRVPPKTRNFFCTLRNRWCRSKSGDRKGGKKKYGEDGWIEKDGASTDYAADNSSEQSSSATQSPQRKIIARQQTTDGCSTNSKVSNVAEIKKFRSNPLPSSLPPPPPSSSSSSSVLPVESILPSLAIFSLSNENKKKEMILRRHSFFQLRIHLKKGVDLIARDKGGTSDPYVKFKVGGRLLHKSKIVYRDLNPVWDETFTIPIEDAFVPVHIKVFDYDWGLQDDFMGSAYLDLTKLDLGKPAEISLELLDPSKAEYLGEIFLTATLLPKTQEDKDLYFQRTSKIGEVSRRLKSQIWSSVVTIVLVEGKNLRAMDGEGFSDPYVRFRLGNEKYKSKVAFKSLNPTWLEQFDFHLYDDQTQVLEVTVCNKEKSKDDFMGRCQIDLTLLERERTHGLWQDLEEGQGSIHLLLTISGTTASETISDLTAHEDSMAERIKLENRYALRNSHHNLRDVGHLTVKVYRATGLAAADLGGKSDPFCVLELVNARLQTQTEYKTLSPSWQKIFTFNVKDINSVLEVTVFDEDKDHKVEFLGKVAIPLLRIKNGEKKWYCLKDKKLRSRAKGNCSRILLEMYVVWNPVRAWIRSLNPKEEKYMQGEVKFKRQVFVKNVVRLKAIIMIFIGWGKSIQECFEWERPAQSGLVLILFIALCYYFEPYMIPAAMLLVFLKYYIVLWLTGEKGNSQDEDEVMGDEEDDEDDKEKEEKKSLKERLQAIQEVTQSVQNAIGYMASLGEQIKNTFNFTVPFVSYLAIGLTLAAAIVAYFIPVRYLIMTVGVNRFARKLIRPHSIPNNEILDLLSRVPDDEDLIAYREFRPYSYGDLDKRREQRKKHKSS